MNAERPPDFPIRLLVDAEQLAETLSVSKRTIWRLEKRKIIQPQLQEGRIRRFCPFTAARQVAKHNGQEYQPPTIAIHVNQANP